MVDSVNDNSLSDRVALVTGGARGIGLAITRHLHALGAKVVIADSGVSVAGDNPDPALARALASELGERATAFTSDTPSSTISHSAKFAASDRASFPFSRTRFTMPLSAVVPRTVTLPPSRTMHSVSDKERSFGSWSTA